MAKNTEICLCLVLLMAVGSNAFIDSWRRMISRTTASFTEDVSEDCIALAHQGSCDFYTCFERRLPCGRSWYIATQAPYYCNKVRRLRANFTEPGQLFLDDSQRCMTSALIEAYQQDMVDCHELKHLAVASISRCAIDNAFCSVFNDNARLFVNIYEPTDLLSRRYFQVWREIGTLAARCGSHSLSLLTQTVSRTLTNVAQNLASRITSIFD